MERFLEKCAESKRRNLLQLLTDFTQFAGIIVFEATIQLCQDLFAATTGSTNEKDTVKAVFVVFIAGIQGNHDRILKVESGLFITAQCRLGRSALGAFANTWVMGQGRIDLRNLKWGSRIFCVTHQFLK